MSTPNAPVLLTPPGPTVDLNLALQARYKRGIYLGLAVGIAIGIFIGLIL